MTFLARQDLFDRISGGFLASIGRPEGFMYLFAAVLVLILLAVLLHLIFSRRGREDLRLFRRLSEANALTPAEAGLLLQAARRAGMAEPGMIFVRRTAFDSAAPDLGVEEARLEALREKVYGE